MKAFVEGDEVQGHLKEIVDRIELEAEIQVVPINDVNRVDDCVIANIQLGIKQLLLQSVIISEKVRNK